MQNLKEVYIIDAVRTPIGSFMGVLSSVSATKLGSIAIKGLLDRTKISPDIVDEVIMGNVIQAGEGQAPARQAALGAGLNQSTQCMTINKVCGSGLKSVMLGAQAIKVGDAEVIIAGGMENMSQIPFYVKNVRGGFKMGNQNLVDGMLDDGLIDAYDKEHMGIIAELCATENNITREEQDNFAIESYNRSLKSIKEKRFAEEIISVEVSGRKGAVNLVDTDEEPGNVNFDKLKSLRPVFKKDGTVTAANASSINDGASAVLLMSKEKAESLGLKPLAKIIAQASFAKDPKWFTTAPIDSIKKVLDKANMNIEDIDLFEVNEAFSVVSLVTNKELGLDPAKVNVNGGAVSLGHPIGASGARILTTLLHAMKQSDAKYGLASLCIGGGEASSVIVEKI
ncbi:MAG: thiolase family protein [Ignavibacteriae bacterium]|nr:thiolase family protein [Ignavibacteriota bacterium]MCB9210404.1 thiolase family protein [Ignavibacteriales bacterium]MCB9219209.1 thiolase family protein [Ignavibacteriales bacterium]MCB9259791.1 thiolase family protein [Ignavibacteriales bacterium]